MIKIYELVNKQGGISLSPFVMTAELFLKHKGLEFESIPLTFVEIGPTIKEATGGKWDKVPTVVFPNGDIVFDSLEIGKYLDEKYPENSLNPSNSDLDNLIEDYNTRIAFNAFRNAIPDLLPLLDAKSQKYFRESREKMLNMTLEEFAGDREANTQQYHSDVKKIDELLSASKFLNGYKPLIHDYILAARIQFFKTISPRTYEDLIINGPNENLKRWIKDMDKELNGYLGKRPTL
ncbi:hypothetical protein CONCODRAFT_14510, partial [Conidiobolus coronatus NRRL 28638]